MLQLEALAHLPEHLAEELDLIVGVRGGELDAEAHLALGHERVCRHRHVDPAVEQEATHHVDVLVVRERDLDEREPRSVGRVDVELVQAIHDLPGLAVDLVPIEIAANVVHAQTGDRRRERSDR
jgi:hypothetical protein